MRSWRVPISSASVGWYPTADGILPSRVETSLPAWTNLKILSMKSNTSLCSLSRKYSAIVSPDNGTRIRTPGASFICPKTSAVFFDTPLSRISFQRSFPSRVRSPTPQNTEQPECSVATLWISSWIRTVLPTPAPPKRPILPPLEYGSRRSMTFIPVSKILASVLCSENDGALRWISQYSVFSSILFPPSIGSPRTLNIRPSVAVPTGTLIFEPVAVTVLSQERPSHSANIIQRTVLFPICCASSITRLLPSTSTVRASLILGRFPDSNSTSTIDPEIWTILPVILCLHLLCSYSF